MEKAVKSNIDITFRTQWNPTLQANVEQFWAYIHSKRQ